MTTINYSRCNRMLTFKRLWLALGMILNLVMPAAASNTTNWPSNDEISAKWQTVPVAKIQQTAEGGDASAMHYLGLCYDKGQRLPEDPFEAARWYQRAIDAGFLPSGYEYGALWNDGRLGEYGLAEASRYYRIAAKAGNVQAEVKLGKLCRAGGWGITRDFAESMRWEQLAAAKGNAEAMVEIAYIYQYGSGIQTNISEAIRWFEKAAQDKNDSLAYANLAVIYEKQGESAKSVQAFQRVADLGVSDTMLKIYTAYWNGYGAPTNRIRAMEWLIKATETRDDHTAEALNNLGMLYIEGKYVKKDEAHGLKLVQKAADAGWKNALIDLAGLYARGIGEPRNNSERPLELLLRTHQWEDLLYRYNEGLGTQRDLVAAAECYCRRGVLYPRSYSLADKIEFQAERPASDRDYFKAPNDLRRVLSLYLKSARHDASAALQIAARYTAGIDGPKSYIEAWAWLTIAKQIGSKEAEAKLQELESHMRHEELSRANEQFEEHARALRHVQDFLR